MVFIIEAVVGSITTVVKCQLWNDEKVCFRNSQ